MTHLEKRKGQYGEKADGDSPTAGLIDLQAALGRVD